MAKFSGQKAIGADYIIVNAEIKTEAIFNKSEAYRFSIKRIWDDKKPKATMIMINPNPNDHLKQGPTAVRVINYLMDRGYGAIEFVNLFAYRTIRSKELKSSKHKIDIVGKGNNQFILDAVGSADLTIAAWGNDGGINGRDKEVLEILKGHELMCFGITKKGRPRYPLGIAEFNNMVLIKYPGIEAK